jgi:hypothetical protein
MLVDVHTKLKAMLWDVPVNRRMIMADEILANPVDAFMNNDQIFIKALNSLKWYELIRLVGKRNLLMLLTDQTLQKVFPAQRRTYYSNARQLLSKYSLPASG